MDWCMWKGERGRSLKNFEYQKIDSQEFQSQEYQVWAQIRDYCLKDYELDSLIIKSQKS